MAMKEVLYRVDDDLFIEMREVGSIWSAIELGEKPAANGTMFAVATVDLSIGEIESVEHNNGSVAYTFDIDGPNPKINIIPPGLIKKYGEYQGPGA